MLDLKREPNVNIRFTSSLTADDENRIAPAVINAIASILDMLPIAYMLRIDTSDSQVYQHSGPRRYPSSGPEPFLARSSAGLEIDS